LAAWIPGTAAMALSTRRTQEAQVIPSMPNWAQEVSKLRRSVFSSAAIGWSPSVTAQIDNPSKLGKVKGHSAEFSDVLLIAWRPFAASRKFPVECLRRHADLIGDVLPKSLLRHAGLVPGKPEVEPFGDHPE
jgi:hypothetical protein